MILIQSPDGKDKCLVENLTGYDGWIVVAEGVQKPDHGCYWCEQDQNWKPLEKSLVERVRNPNELAAIIAEIQAQIAALQGN